MTATETSEITFGETRLAYGIRRSQRRKKTVSVSVDPNGHVLLIAPQHLSTARLDAVVRRKAKWIVQRLRHVESNGTALSPREFVSGESVLYLGRHYRLKVHAQVADKAKLTGGWLHVSAPPGSEHTTEIREAVVSWFRHHAAQRLPERVKEWQSKAGVPMPKVIIADQQKRWGSCDSRGTIRLNWRRCDWSITLWSTNSSICGIVVTDVTTGRPWERSCRTMSAGARTFDSSGAG